MNTATKYWNDKYKKENAKSFSSVMIDFTNDHFDKAIKELEKEKLKLSYATHNGYWQMAIKKCIQTLKDYKPKIL